MCALWLCNRGAYIPRLRVVSDMAAADCRIDVVESLFTAALREAPVIAYVASWLGMSIICSLDGCSSVGRHDRRRSRGLQDQSRHGVGRARMPVTPFPSDG